MEMVQTMGSDPRLKSGRDVDIRAIKDIRSGAETLTQSFYFEGLNLLHCYEGSYRIVRKGCPVVQLDPGEVLFVYPGHVVTIDALSRSNRLVCGIFTGRDVVGFFNGLGCFDGLHSTTLPRLGCIAKLRELMKPEVFRTASGHDVCLSYLADIIVSVIGDARANGKAVVFDAIRQVRENLSKGIVRLQELCDALKVSRSYLQRVFRDVGFGSISEFIKTEQLQRALWLLRNTDQSVAEIAKASGFISTTHFSTFIRKRVGRPPRELR